MASPGQTSAQIITEEIRRQVTLQVPAAESLDTRALGVTGAVAAVAAFIAPRVTVDSPQHFAAAAVTLVFMLGALVCLLLCVRPRSHSFSNGPDVTALAYRVDDPPDSLEHELVQAFVEVRNQNELFLQSKGGWMLLALRLLFATLAGLAAMVAVGAIR